MGSDIGWKKKLLTQPSMVIIFRVVNKRLSGWSSKRLSMAGRHTLIQSTLGTIANYNMQSAKIPRSICDSIDRKTRRFLWGGDENKKPIHLISWDNVQKPKLHGGLGIMSARQANAAFLTKLGWRVLTEPDRLWSRILRAKYCSNRCDIDIFTSKPGMSHVWAGITSQSKTIVGGSAIAVGNGRKTLFWDHAWVDGFCLSDYNIIPIPETILGATVSEMWCEEMGWKWDQFANFLPQFVLQKIASISLVNDPEQSDTLYWNGTSSGKFTLKSALGILKEFDFSEQPESFNWRAIWKLPVQQRVRMFIWLAAHDRLMVNVNRVVRNLGDNPMCPRCNEKEESTDHLLRDCYISRHIWQLIGIGEGHISFYTSSFEDWISKNASNEVITHIEDWPARFALTCWWIWKWRNIVVFNRGNENPINPREFLMSQFESTKWALDKHSIFIPQAGVSRSEVCIRWLPPPQGWTLLNTDGASKGNPGLAGGGGIFRDETGNFITAYYLSCGVCTSMKAELLALLTGLERAKAMGVTRLLIHMDNKPCLNMVNEEQLVSNSLKFIVLRCKKLIQDPRWLVKLDHTYREANRAADLLANHGVDSSTSPTHLDIPFNALRCILREDIFG